MKVILTPLATAMAVVLGLSSARGDPTLIKNVHGHILDLGLQGAQIQLFGTASLRQAQGKIVAYAKAHPDKPWLLGGGWNQVQWKLKRFPTAEELEAEVSDRPAAAGITRESP